MPLSIRIRARPAEGRHEPGDARASRPASPDYELKKQPHPGAGSPARSAAAKANAAPAYSSLKALVIGRRNPARFERMVSVAETPGMRRMPSKIVRMRCSLSTQ